MNNYKSKFNLIAAAFLLFAFASVNSQAQTTWYVNVANAGPGDGLTPSTAFPNIKDAVAAALANTATSDTILVAAGTYGPANISDSNHIRLETSCTLSGSWNAAFTAASLENTPTIVDLNNEKKFMRMRTDGNPPSGRYINGQRTVENFIVRNSSNTESSNNDDAGAIEIQNAGDRNVLRNVYFQNCSALFEGGVPTGTARSGGAFMIRQNSKILIEDCIFRTCFSVSRGGVAYLRTGADGCEVIANRCLFVNNTSPQGTLFYTDGSQQNSTFTLTNCIFRDNFGIIGSVPSVSTMFDNLSCSSTRILNCTFVGNDVVTDLFELVDTNVNGRLLELTNNIFVDNQFGGSFISYGATPADWDGTTNTLLVRYNLLDGNAADVLDQAGTTLVGVNNNFAGTAALANAAGDNYAPLPGSDAIDAGLALAEVIDDYEGDTRPQDAGYDIGAIEGAIDLNVTNVNRWTLY